MYHPVRTKYYTLVESPREELYGILRASCTARRRTLQNLSPWKGRHAIVLCIVYELELLHQMIPPRWNHSTSQKL